MRALQALRSLLLVAAAALLVVGLDRHGHLQRVNDLIAEQRMSLAQRPASGNIVHLAIDKKSLDRIGVWPWTRETYARIIEALVENDVAAIALDVDFSLASSPEADRSLARALEAAGGSVILPVFVQNSSVRDGDASVGVNMPLAIFRDHAWLAAANVAPDADGVVRRFPYSLGIGGSDVPSLPALLAGKLGENGADIAINFGITPGTVAAFSVIDLLEGRIGADELSGRSVVVGAHAIELGDRFNVPVHGVVSGPLLQILAAETLVQGIELLPVDSRALLLGVAALIIFVNFSRRLVSLRRKLLALAAAAVALECAGGLLLARHSLVLPTGGAHLALIASATAFALRELDLRGWLLRVARTAATNTQLVLERIIEDSSDAVLVVAEDDSIIEMSRYARQLFGSSKGCVLSLNDHALKELAVEVRDSIAALRAGRWRPSEGREAAFQVGAEDRLFEYTVTPSRLDLVGKRSRAENQAAFVACVTARDVTERRRHEARLDHLARFDQETGAMRRSELLVQLEAAMAAWPDEGKPCAVLAFNLHRFGAVNATLGRAVGDLILSSLVRRLEGCDSRLSSVARLGGDTFASFTSTGVGAEEAQEIARKVINLVNEPFDVDGTTVRVGAHVGLVLAHPSGRRPAGAILGNAEAALDEARKFGGNAVKAFDPASFARQSHARSIERELWSALRNHQMRVVYQPQVRLSDFRLVGAEALVRWEHPILGQISPGEFIGIAEANGFIEELGRWVLEKACMDAAWWPADLAVAVNVSPLQLTRGDLVAGVKLALQRSRLRSSRLHIEITESSFLAPTEGLFEMLADIRALGVSLALDDFGTGFSSLGYLTRLPIDKIKIDRTFVQRVGTERVGQSVLKSARTLTEELGVKLICEGVETKDELDFVRKIGCDEGQGFLFGRPQSETQFQSLARGRAVGS